MGYVIKKLKYQLNGKSFFLTNIVHVSSTTAIFDMFPKKSSNK